jgi:hypothetical protein
MSERIGPFLERRERERERDRERERERERRNDPSVHRWAIRATRRKSVRFAARGAYLSVPAHERRRVASLICTSIANLRSTDVVHAGR